MTSHTLSQVSDWKDGMLRALMSVNGHSGGAPLDCCIAHKYGLQEPYCNAEVNNRNRSLVTSFTDE
jgi:hypothetical protein